MEEIAKNALDNSENFLTSDLPDRYGISKSVIYDRLKALHIKPYKQGNRSYISGVELALMDELDAHLTGTNNEMESFVSEQIANGRITIAVEQTELVVVRPEAEVVKAQQLPPEVLAAEEIEISSESSQSEWIAELQSEKQERIEAADLQAVNERAQKRAFNMAMTEETLTLIYETTEEFTIPGMKENLKKHRAECRQGRGKRSHNVDDFFSKCLALNPALKAKVAGSKGLPASENSNSNQLNT